jgi:hypothetical protein
MIKFQNYKHYKLPITINPLEYGKLIYQNINFYILCFNKTNLALITANDLYNHIKFYREGNFIFEYKDHKIDDSTFVRSIANKKFTFKNGKIISIDYQELIVLIAIITLILFIISPENSLNIA